uniref:MORF/ORRM1/DAG-like MORF domain-containing protein n=1 Tax=Cucumis melo TaxID=3656 RepID=A0A9I9EE95_CUCME
MATQLFSRSLPKTLIWTSTFSRSFLTATGAALSASSHSSSSLLRRLRPLAAILAADFRCHSAAPSVRDFSTRATSSSLNDPNPNWSNRPPKETILLDGCDFEHWLVVMEKPDEQLTRDEIIDSYIKTLAMVVGSEEEARMKIYSVSTRCYFAFGCLVSEELSYKIKVVPNSPQSYLKFVGSFLIHIWTLRIKIMELKLLDIKLFIISYDFVHGTLFPEKKLKYAILNCQYGGISMKALKFLAITPDKQNWKARISCKQLGVNLGAREPFINGQAVPYDPKYHEEWIRNNARANERNKRNDRPRNADRSRNFERRRENMQNREFPNPSANQPTGPNMSAQAPSSMPPNNFSPGMPPHNHAQGNYPGGPPPPNNFNRPPPPPPHNFNGPPPPPHNFNRPPPPPPHNFNGPPHNFNGPPPPPHNFNGPPPPPHNFNGPPPPQYNFNGPPPPPPNNFNEPSQRNYAPASPNPGEAPPHDFGGAQANNYWGAQQPNNYGGPSNSGRGPA